MIDKIYEKCDKETEIIFQLENGRRIIKRSDDIVNKLNLDKWEEINYLPDDFKEVKRKITPEERKEIKSFLTEEYNIYKKEYSIWEKITNFISGKFNL